MWGHPTLLNFTVYDLNGVLQSNFDLFRIVEVLASWGNDRLKDNDWCACYFRFGSVSPTVQEEQKLLINNKYFVLLFAKDSTRIGLGPKQRSSLCSLYIFYNFFNKNEFQIDHRATTGKESVAAV